MVSKQKVLVTGASGLIGGLVIKNLGNKYEFSALNRRPIEGIPFLQADISNFESIQPAFYGIETVLHLGALATPGLTNNWDGIASTSRPWKNPPVHSCSLAMNSASDHL